MPVQIGIGCNIEGKMYSCKNNVCRQNVIDDVIFAKKKLTE